MPSLLGGINEKAFERFTQPLKDGFDSQTFKLSKNTEVFISERYRFIKLWASKIVEWRWCNDGMTFLSVCLCGYATDTTMRRVNAVLLKLYEYGVIAERYFFGKYKGSATFGTNANRCEWEAYAPIVFDGVPSVDPPYCSTKADVNISVRNMMLAGMQSKQSKAMKIALSVKRRKFSQMEGVL